MKKKILISLLALSLTVPLAACGGETPETPQTPVSSTASESGSQSPDQEEVTAAVYEHFTSGTLYDQGEYFFAIDSIELTEEGLVMTYRASSERQRHDEHGAAEFDLLVNGVRLMDWKKSDTFRYSDPRGDKNSDTMIMPGRDANAKMVIERKWIDALGITSVPDLQLSVNLGSYSDGLGFHKGVEFSAHLFAGEEREFEFPEAVRESWLLFDNEYGKAQITHATYSNEKNIWHYVLVEGRQTGKDERVQFSVQTNGGTVGELSGQMWLTEDVPVLYERLLAQANDPDLESYRQPVATVKLTNNGNLDTVLEFQKTLDMQGLE